MSESPFSPPDYLVANRNCGSCVACCDILEIDDPQLKKPPHILCPHSTGAACGIYPARPQTCRTWYCLWRRIDAMPELLRPDKSRVVFSIDQRIPERTPFERNYIVARAMDGPADFERPQIKSVLEMFIVEGSLPVWISFGGNKRMIYPNPEFADAIVNPQTTTRQSLVSAARDWRKQYGMG